jgi:hypothetical protein
VEHESGIETGFSPSAWVFSYRFHSTDSPYASLSKCCLYQKDERANPESLTKSNARSEIREHWVEKNIHFLFHVSNGQLATRTGAALHLP